MVHDVGFVFFPSCYNWFTEYIDDLPVTLSTSHFFFNDDEQFFIHLDKIVERCMSIGVSYSDQGSMVEIPTTSIQANEETTVGFILT